MQIVIQGAGIAGLTLGASLHNSEVIILEKRNRVSGIGAGILLHDESLTALSSVGIKLSGRRFERFNVGLADGRLLKPVKKSGLAITREYLHAELRAANEGNTIKTSTSITSFSEKQNGVSLVLSDESNIDADILVGADGIGSGVRKLHEYPSVRKYAGATCWRAIGNFDCGISNPLELWGNGIRVGMVPLEEGTYFYITESLDSEGSIHQIPLGRISQFSYNIPDLIKKVPEDSWMQNDLSELDRHFFGTAQIPMIGDAAHAFTPNLGEGAAQSILDAVYLSKCLTSGAHYPGDRAKKNARIAKLSRFMGRMAQAKGFQARLRDCFMFSFVSKNRKA